METTIEYTIIILIAMTRSVVELSVPSIIRKNTKHTTKITLNILFYVKQLTPSAPKRAARICLNAGAIGKSITSVI